MNEYTTINEFPDKKIIIVDDDKINLKVLGRLLEKYKVQVESLQSGFELLDSVKNSKNCDLIISDDMMPQMSGTETMQKLKSKPEFNIPIVVLTGNTVDGEKEKYLSAGFDEYMGKPINKNELDVILNKYLN